MNEQKFPDDRGVIAEVWWHDGNAGCKFVRDGKVQNWENLSEQEQVSLVMSMYTIADMFGRHLVKTAKPDENNNLDKTK